MFERWEESEAEFWNMLCCTHRQVAHRSSVTAPPPPLPQLSHRFIFPLRLSDIKKLICFRLQRNDGNGHEWSNEITPWLTSGVHAQVSFLFANLKFKIMVFVSSIFFNIYKF